MSQLITRKLQTEEKTVQLVRIGTSQCYLGVRSNKNDDGETWNTVCMYHWGDSGSVEIESYDLPTSTQAAELVKLFSQFL